METNKIKKMKATKKAISALVRKIESAKTSYEKIMLELAPFTPSVKGREITTEGTWQKTASIAGY